MRALLLILGSAGVLNAQQIVTSSNLQITAAQTGGLGNTVTLSISGLPLKDALREVGRQSGLKIAYAGAVISSEARVSVNIKNVSPSEAIKQILRGTKLTYRLSADGQILIEPGAQGRIVAQGVITGRVTDTKTSRGVSGANVSIGDGRGTTSGEDGSFRLQNVAAGTHTLVVRLVGYAKQAKSVTVGEGATVTVDFKLEPSANVLDQVIVTGTIAQTELKAVPNAITVVTAKQIQERGITRIDQLFRGDIPGLFSLNTGLGLDSVIMFSRGANKINPGGTSDPAGTITNPIKTYIDGIQMADPRTLSQIDPGSIDRIEILTGPQASTIYGENAINGVMQIFTKRGTSAKPMFTVGVTEGMIQNNFSNAVAVSHIVTGSVSGIEGKISYNAGSSWDYSGAWSPGNQSQRTSINGGVRRDARVFAIDLSGRQGWTKNNVAGEIRQVITDNQERGLYTVSSGSGITTPAKQSLSGQTLGASISYTQLKWWSHQINVGKDVSDQESIGSAPSFRDGRFDTTYSNGILANTRSSQTYSSTLQVPVMSFSHVTLAYGGDKWRNRSTRQTWTVNPTGTTANVSVVRFAPQKNSGAYVQGQLAMWDAFFLTYGLRADWNPNYGANARVRPGRYGVAYTRNLGNISMKLRGSYGRAIRPPEGSLIQGSLVTFPDVIAAYSQNGQPLYGTLPNPELGAEFQQGGEGGLELYIGSRGTLVVTRYNQTVDGLINFVNGIDSVRAVLPGVINVSGCFATSNLRSDGYCYRLQTQFLNVGSIRNQGWELLGSVNTGPFTTRGTYSWTKSRVIGITPRYRRLLTEAAFIPGATFDFVPEHTWAFSTSYSKRATTVAIYVNGLGPSFRSSGTEIDILTSTSLRLRPTDTQRYLMPNGFRQWSPGYALADMNASHRFSSRIDGTLQVSNLTDSYHNDLAITSPVAGRRTRVGARLRW